MAKIITDMETWLMDYSDRIYRYVVYKKLFTPYEQQRAFQDESQFEDIHYKLCKIEEAIELSNGDWLLGLRVIGDDGEVFSIVEYHKLSDIKLALFDRDEGLELWREDEEE